MTVVEATMRAELRNSRSLEKVQCLAVQKNAATVSDLLYLTFQPYLPSESAARVNGLGSLEAPMKRARTFTETLRHLRTRRERILTVVMDLKGSPKPLQLLSSLRALVSSLVGNAFAIYKKHVKVIRNDQAFMETLNLLEIEMASRTHEENEEKRKQKNASLAMAVFSPKGLWKG